MVSFNVHFLWRFRAVVPYCGLFCVPFLWWCMFVVCLRGLLCVPFILVVSFCGICLGFMFALLPFRGILWFMCWVACVYFVLAIFAVVYVIGCVTLFSWFYFGGFLFVVYVCVPLCWWFMLVVPCCGICVRSFLYLFFVCCVCARSLV